MKCYRLKGRCSVESSSNWQNMYYMVRVQGGWRKETTVYNKTILSVQEGWSKTVSETVGKATERSAEAGFTVGGFSFGGSISRSVAKTTVRAIRQYTSKTVEHTATAGGGAFIWTWVWTVTLGTTRNEVFSNVKVQSTTKPKCLPEGNRDDSYQLCKRKDVCLEANYAGCEAGAFIVGDYVTHVRSNRPGQIVEINYANDRPYKVKMQDDGFPPQGNFRARDLKLWEWDF